MMMRWMTTWVLFVFSTSVWAISPYLQGDSVKGGNVQAAATAVESKLKTGGFKVVGKYFPKTLAGYGVVIATDEAMLDEVGSVGGNAILGAAIRVGVTADGSVAYTNPDYWYRAYFRKAFAKKEDAVKALQARLQDALGAGKGLGGDESASSLANYRYMIGMERLDSPKNKLAEYGSFAEALKTVRDNLAKGVGKTAKIYEVVMPNRKLAVFGVAMNDGENSDGDWIKKIDMQNNIAGLPYEIYVVDKEVESPHGRFRIALAFPDVGMGQFMRISSLPNTILETMSAVAGVEKKSSGEAWQQ
ncbi:MAG: hypothetical protein J0I46_02685 [Thiobacillus sp.]|jgi:hypothetical protein|nr:hypothetical protein [Thiobacillus sp.]MBN8778845.1 hypothetical protein [Thiobacillus sp.]ODV01327.1 MAG: hypothetical protein ABT23_08895 [Thiobacillus sp. SCN 63-57]OJY58745.1 MAG: hypothetical protein BGP19_16780 [Thiobacillus sp. 0-1251]